MSLCGNSLCATPRGMPVRRHLPRFRLNTRGAALKRKKKLPRLEKREAPAHGTWVHVYRAQKPDGAWGRVRLACDTCCTYEEAVAHNATKVAAAREGKAEAAPSPLWEVAWGAYLKTRATPAHAALKSMEAHWFAPVFGGKRLRQVTPALCLEVLQRAEAAGLAASTRRLLFTTARAAMQHAVDVLECLETNPFRRLKPPKVPRVERPTLSVEQAAQLLAGAGRHRLLFLLTVVTGLRRAEVGGLRWTDVHWKRGAHGTLVVARSWDRATTKGKEARPIPLHPVLRQALAEACAASSSPLIFPSPTTGGMRSETWHAAELLRRVARRAGVEVPPGLTFHGLRRTFATLLQEANGNLQLTQRLLGHASAATTDGYIGRTNLAPLEKAVSQLPLFPPPPPGVPLPPGPLLPPSPPGLPPVGEVPGQPLPPPPSTPPPDLLRLHLMKSA